MNKQRNLVIGLIIVLVLVIFACLNTEPVAINFGFFQPKMPLIIVLVIMLLLGALVSLLIGKGEKVSPDVKKALAKQKKELDNKIPMQRIKKNMICKLHKSGWYKTLF